MPGGREPHPFDATSGTDDDWLRAAKQQIQALLFHWRLEAADDRDASVSQCSGQIVGMHDDVARTFGGAKETERGNLKDVEIADGPNSRAGGCQRSIT